MIRVPQLSESINLLKPEGVKQTQMKRLLLTGGSGFIGKNISSFLSKKYKLFTPSHKELDLLDSEKVKQYVVKNQINYIIHAANVGGTRDKLNQKDIVYTNLMMFYNLVRNLDKVDKMLYFGSGSEYDKRYPIKFADETDFEKRIPADDYGFYKYICSKYTRTLKLDKLICLRLFGIYGPYENYLVKFISNTIVKNLFNQPIKINQNVYFDYLYVEDLFPVINYFLTHKSEYYDYNVCTGRKISLIEITRTVSHISGNPLPIRVNHKGLNNEYTGSNKRLLKEIPNLKITSAKEGINKLYHWYKKHIDIIDKRKVIEDKFIKYCKTKT